MLPVHRSESMHFLVDSGILLTTCRNFPPLQPSPTTFPTWEPTLTPTKSQMPSESPTVPLEASASFYTFVVSLSDLCGKSISGLNLI